MRSPRPRCDSPPASRTEHCLLLLGEARVHDALNDGEASLALYKRVLHLDAGNVEAMACMAAHHFYSDQPEVALRFYRHASPHLCLSRLLLPA